MPAQNARQFVRLKSCQSVTKLSLYSHDKAHEKSVEFPPRLSIPSYVKDPAILSEVVKSPSSDENSDVESDRDGEKVSGKDELMVPEMGDEPEQDGEGERDRPEKDGVW